MQNWVLLYMNENAQLSRSSCYIFTFLCLSLIYLVQVEQIE